MPGVVIPTDTDYFEMAMESALGVEPASWTSVRKTQAMREVSVKAGYAGIDSKNNSLRQGSHRKSVGKPSQEVSGAIDLIGLGSDVADGNAGTEELIDLLTRSCFNASSTNLAEATTVKTATSPTTTVIEKEGGESAPPIVGGHLCVEVGTKVEMCPILGISSDEITLAQGSTAATDADDKLGAVNSVLHNDSRGVHGQSLFVKHVAIDDDGSHNVGGFVPSLEFPESGDGDVPELKFSGAGVRHTKSAAQERNGAPGEEVPTINARGQLKVSAWTGTAQEPTLLEYWGFSLKITKNRNKKGAAHDPDADATAQWFVDDIECYIYVPKDDDPVGSESYWRDKFLNGKNGELVLITAQQGDERGCCYAVTCWGFYVAGDPEDAEYDNQKVDKVMLKPAFLSVSGAPTLISVSRA